MKFTLSLQVKIISNIDPVFIRNLLRLVDARLDLNGEAVVVLGKCQV